MEIENVNCKARVSECADVELLNVDRLIKPDKEITGLEKLVEELHKVFAKDHVNIQDVQKLMAGYKSNRKDWKKFAKFDRFRYTRNLVDAGNGLFNIMILCWGPGHASAIHDHADSHCFMKLLSGSLDEVRYDWPETVEPEVLKKLRNKTRRRCCSEAFEIEENLISDLTDLNMNCQGDRCQNCGGKFDSNGNEWNENERNETEHYHQKNMVEIGRTRLEVNDVCYINDALGLHRMENPSYVDGAVSLHLYAPPFDSCQVFDERTGKASKVNVTFWSMYGQKVKRVIEANESVDSQ